MEPERPDLAPTGIAGLDFILCGGLPRGRAHLVHGGPGTGKTTLALQFLREGVRAGERCVFVSLSQHEDDLEMIARSHGWSLEGIDVHDVSRRHLAGGASSRQSVVHTADAALGEEVDRMCGLIREDPPDRFVFDSIEVLRALAGGVQSRYRDEVALLLEAVREHAVTALFIDAIPSREGEQAFQALAHGVIELFQDTPPYGAERRHLRVRKMRGLDFISGQHNLAIRTGGVEVFPRLQKPNRGQEEQRQVLSSGIEALDTLFGGGLQSGTAALIAGESGTGKTTLATAYLQAALERGEGGAAFLFDERPNTFVRRSVDLGMDLRPYVENGQLHLQAIDTGEVTPGEFAQMLRRAADRGARVVTIDSLTGYFHAMQDQQMLVTQMREMLTYMSQRGVLSLLVEAQHGLVGTPSQNRLDVSYIADTAVLLRNFEAGGAVRRAISVIKKRYGDHEKRIRELRITSEGLEVGEPLGAFQGVLGGSPTFTGKREQLLSGNDDE